MSKARAKILPISVQLGAVDCAKNIMWSRGFSAVRGFGIYDTTSHRARLRLSLIDQQPYSLLTFIHLRVLSKAKAKSVALKARY